ncbi:putative spermidine synthase [Senna tora]|uniref:Putative spermidine synthase n=1 Tax=Senna tora TaxID=362788 RepID=A0A834TUM6_9FABA|nr:putative spermidine synthase [Senna tora]
MRGSSALPLTKLALPSIANDTFLLTFPISAIRLRHSFCFRSNTTRTRKPFFTHRVKANADFSSASVSAQHREEDDDDDDDESFRVLTAVKSDYNDIMIVDTPKSRMLLLDSSRTSSFSLSFFLSLNLVWSLNYCVHSILYKEKKWTGSYWDEFATLPAIVPEGPIAILGLGGGTAAHLMLDLWPSLQLEGWEIDQILIDKARDYFGLSGLEKPTKDGGILTVHIDDVFVPSENLQRRYAGIVVDLFSDGKVLPQLQEVSTWLELHERLMPGGRFMVNCGGNDGESKATDAETLSSDKIWLQIPALRALSKVFPGQLNWKRMPKENGENFMALTGSLPDLESWSASLPPPLSTNVKHWRPFIGYSFGNVTENLSFWYQSSTIWGMVNTIMEGKMDSIERDFGTVKRDINTMKKHIPEIKESIGKLVKRVANKDEGQRMEDSGFMKGKSSEGQ